MWQIDQASLVNASQSTERQVTLQKGVLCTTQWTDMILEKGGASRTVGRESVMVNMLTEVKFVYITLCSRRASHLYIVQGSPDPGS